MARRHRRAPLCAPAGVAAAREAGAAPRQRGAGRAAAIASPSAAGKPVAARAAVSAPDPRPRSLQARGSCRQAPVAPIIQTVSPDAAPPDDTPAWEEAPAHAAPVAPRQNQPVLSRPPRRKTSRRSGPGQTAQPADDTAFETLQSPDSENPRPHEFEPLDEDRFEPVAIGDPDFEMLDGPLEGAAELATPVFASERKKTQSPRLRTMNGQAWPALAASLPVTGLAAELARQSEWLGVQGEQINLRVAIRTLAESPGKARLCTVLSEHFGTVVQLNVEYGATGDETAHAVAQAQKVVRQQEAEQAVAVDPFVQILVSEFGAKVVPGSISAVPLDRAA